MKRDVENEEVHEQRHTDFLEYFHWCSFVDTLYMIRKRSLPKTLILILLLKTVQKMYDTRASGYVSVGNGYLVGYCTYMWIPS